MPRWRRLRVRNPDFATGFRQTVAARVAWDGSLFHGYQRQPNAFTVQETLETALHACVGTRVPIASAGRTDAGVHSTGQVIAAHVGWNHSLSDLARAWNSRLPGTVAILDVHRVPEDFHPRFDALTRTYEYHVLFHRLPTAPRRWPLQRSACWYVPVPLDLRGMNQAASLLTGTRDFGFLGAAPDGGHTVRTVLKACWERTPSVWGNRKLQALRFTVTANAFLFRMVRRMVALTVKVGRRQLTLADLRSLRDSVGGVTPGPAPANGLVLSRVTYATPISDMWKAGKA